MVFEIFVLSINKDLKELVKSSRNSCVICIICIFKTFKYTRSDKLYLIGDIIDGWALRKKWYWPQTHNDIVQKILRKARHGTKVYYVAGNHDELLRKFIPVNFGKVQIVNQIIHTTETKKKYLVIHGDQFDGVMQYARWLSKLSSYINPYRFFIIKIFNQKLCLKCFLHNNTVYLRITNT